jgi:hypothetical protein
MYGHEGRGQQRENVQYAIGDSGFLARATCRLIFSKKFIFIVLKIQKNTYRQ